MNPEHMPYLIRNSPLLEAWLRKATRGLCPEAVDRVSREIKEHYLAAVEERMADGTEWVSAEASALKTLGSARAARRRFKVSDLTWRQAWIASSTVGQPLFGIQNKDIRYLRGRPSLVIFSLVVLLWTVIPICLGYVSKNGNPFAAFPVMLTLTQVLPFLPRLIFHPYQTSAALLIPRLRALYPLQSFICLAACIVMLVGFQEFRLSPPELKSNLPFERFFGICLYGLMLALILEALLSTQRTLRKISQITHPPLA